jgi:hypothetical protein
LREFTTGATSVEERGCQVLPTSNSVFSHANLTHACLNLIVALLARAVKSTSNKPDVVAPNASGPVMFERMREASERSLNYERHQIITLSA